MAIENNTAADEEVIPEGKIKTKSGNIIDRADACYMLAEHPKNKNLLFSRGGTCYIKDSKGTLRRYPQKQKGKKQK